MSVVRPFLPEDHPQVVSMWTKRSAPVLPLSALPKTGAIVDGIAAGFVYQTDSSIAWIEWLVSNPEVDAPKRGKALDDVIAHLISAAKSQGFELLFTVVSHDKLKERYLKHGFITGTTNSTEMMRTL